MLLPNVRKLFIPDPEYIIVDADLSGADAQVVAWEAEDADLKAAFRRGEKVHAKNAEKLWGSRFTNLPGELSKKSTPLGKKYDECKRGVHATNYGASARTLHLNPDIGWPLSEAEWFQTKWFSLHPGIKEWHRRTERQLQSSRTIQNAFGYRIVYFDRIDALLPQALAWGPQSTVAEVCFRGALQLEDKCPWVEMLLQVHDSLVFQVPLSYWHPERINEIRKSLEVPIPYSDPLIIKWKIAASPLSWGDCKECPETLQTG